MPRLISKTEYLFIFLALAAFTILSAIFGNTLAFVETASISAVTLLSLFLSEIEFKTEAANVLITQITISFVSYVLMHMHGAVDWF